MRTLLYLNRLLYRARGGVTTLIRSSSSGIPDMPPCDVKPEPYNGPSYDEIMKIRKKNLNPSLLTFYRKHVLVNQGHMQWLWDDKGRRYLDLFAGIVTISVGHCHPKVTAAATKQMNKLWHTTNIYLYPEIHKYAEKLVSKLPGNLKNVLFVNSGSEANDLAMHMARLYTGSFDIIALRNGYHGASPYSVGLTQISSWKYNTASGFGIHGTMNPDVYRGPWGGQNCRDSPVQTQRSCDCPEGQCSAGDMYVEQLNDLLRHSVPKGRTAGFFAEGIQGVGGTVQYPRNFLKKAFESVRETGGVCISDEVQTGFGRTGTHYWNFESHGVTPDIVTMAKGMGNGFPMAAVITTPEIAAMMSGATHFNTFGGNPMASAVGLSVLDVIDEDGCQENCHTLGTYFLLELAKFRDDFEVVGDVRGKGLMIGVECVQDKETKTPLAADQMVDIWEDCKDMGVLLGKGGLYGNVFRIKPPMCITKDDVNFALAVMRKALENHREKNG